MKTIKELEKLCDFETSVCAWPNCGKRIRKVNGVWVHSEGYGYQHLATARPDYKVKKP